VAVKRIFHVILIFSCLISGCRTSVTQDPLTPEPLVDTAEFLRPGDSVTLEFSSHGLPFLWNKTIREDGSLLLPLTQSIVAAGKTRHELEKAVEDAYKPAGEFGRNFKVHVVTNYYWVSGEVRNPGLKAYSGPITALEAIEKAGYTDFTLRRPASIIRSDGRKVKINLKRAAKNPKFDPFVYPGDRVHISRD